MLWIRLLGLWSHDCCLLMEIFCPLLKSGRGCAVRSNGDQLCTAPVVIMFQRFNSKNKNFSCPVVLNYSTNIYSFYIHKILPSLTLPNVSPKLLNSTSNFSKMNISPSSFVDTPRLDKDISPLCSPRFLLLNEWTTHHLTTCFVYF